MIELIYKIFLHLKKTGVNLPWKKIILVLSAMQFVKMKK